MEASEQGQLSLLQIITIMTIQTVPQDKWMAAWEDGLGRAGWHRNGCSTSRAA